MSKKLMLLAAGALAALAFTALPAVASAGEFEAHCSSGAVCNGTISSGTIILQDDSGGVSGRTDCITVTGALTQTSTSSTGTATLTFDGCTEAATGGECENEGVGTKKIATNQLVTHLVYPEPNKSTPSVLFTGINITYICHTFLGNVTRTWTGSVIGEIENPNCGIAKTFHAINFRKVNPAEATSPQTWMQITTTGTKFDLTSGSHVNDTTTSPLTATWSNTYTPAGTTVTLTC